MIGVAHRSTMDIDTSMKNLNLSAEDALRVVNQVKDAPCILYDLDGYYTGLRMLLSHMIETGLSSEERQEGIYFAKDLAEIKAILNR